MAISYDTSTDGGSATATSLTFSHTCTGEHVILWVSATTNTVTVSGIKYNNVSMTLANSQSVGSNNSYLFYLFNPSTGANNVVVSLSGSGTISACSASYTGAQQTGSLDSSAKTSNSSTSITVSTTTVANNCWVVSGGSTAASAATAGSGTTVRQSTASTYHPYITDSNGAITPAGSASQAVNCSSGGNTMIIASFTPYVAVTSTVSIADTTSLSDAVATVKKISVAIADTVSGLVEAIGMVTNRFFTAFTKTAASFTNKTKNAATFTNKTKNDVSVTNKNKSI